MTLNRAGVVLLGGCAMTIVFFFIDINFYSDHDFTKDRVNEILMWSLLRGIVVSLAVNIGNYFRSSKKERS